jgi:hypothetical protein
LSDSQCFQTNPIDLIIQNIRWKVIDIGRQ